MPSRIDDIDPRAYRVAEDVARDLAADGAVAVLLTGSHARGDAQPESDLDFIALYDTPRNDDWKRAWGITSRDGILVCASWETAAGAPGCFRDPRLIPTFVPGWRGGLILHDTDGLAARLQQEARDFTWDAVTAECDAYVAEHVTGWAEEIHKLVAAMRLGSAYQAAINRSLIALGAAGIIAVHRRILFGTENVLWDMVCDVMREPWTSDQRAALSLAGESLDESCRAALRLYLLLAEETRPLMSEQQRAVVDRACDLASAALA